MKDTWKPAIVSFLLLGGCIFFIDSLARLSLPWCWLYAGPVYILLRILFFPTCRCEPSKDMADLLRKERDFIENVLNTRVTFLITTAAILGAAATQLKNENAVQFTFGVGAAASALAIVGIDRACAKVNFCLSALNRSPGSTEQYFRDQQAGFSGLPGSIYTASYGLALLIFLVFCYLASPAGNVGHFMPSK